MSGWFDTGAMVKIIFEKTSKLVGCVWEQNTIPHTKPPSKRMSEIAFIKKMNSGRIRSRAENGSEKVVHSSEGSRSLNHRIELKFGGVVDMGIPQQMNGWIFQRTSELGSGDRALNSSRFPSGFDGAPVYHRLPEIPPSELDEIWHGCCTLNSAQFHRRNRQSDARGGGSGYKFAVRKNNTVA